MRTTASFVRSGRASSQDNRSTSTPCAAASVPSARMSISVSRFIGLLRPIARDGSHDKRSAVLDRVTALAYKRPSGELKEASYGQRDGDPVSQHRKTYRQVPGAAGPHRPVERPDEARRS